MFLKIKTIPRGSKQTRDISFRRTLMITLVKTLHVQTGRKNIKLCNMTRLISPELINLCTTAKYTIIMYKYTVD